MAPPPRTARAWIPGADGTQVAAPGIFWGEVSPGSHKYRARPGGATSWRCRLGSLESSGSRGLHHVKGIPPPGLHGVRGLELRQCTGTRRTRGPVTSLLAILGMFLVKQNEKRTAPPWKLGFGFWESRPRALVPSSFPSRECVFSFNNGFLPCFCTWPEPQPGGDTASACGMGQEGKSPIVSHPCAAEGRASPHISAVSCGRSQPG